MELASTLSPRSKPHSASVVWKLPRVLSGGLIPCLEDRSEWGVLWEARVKREIIHFLQGGGMKDPWNDLGVGNLTVRKAASAVGGMNFGAEGFGIASAHWWKVKKCVSFMQSLSEGAFPVTPGGCDFLRICFIADSFSKAFEGFYFLVLELLLFYLMYYYWCHESWNRLFYFKTVKGIEI